MNPETLNKFVLKQHKIQEGMKLASFEVFQDIMQQYVGEVVARVHPLGNEILDLIQAQVEEPITPMDRESVVGLIATGIWAEISNNLQNQVIRSAISDENVN